MFYICMYLRWFIFFRKKSKRIDGDDLKVPKKKRKKIGTLKASLNVNESEQLALMLLK